MLNRIFVVDSVTLSSTGTAVSSYVPWEQTTRKLPTQVVVKATGQGAYVRLSNDASAATNVDVLVQGGDHVVLSVQGRRWVSVLSDGASSTVSVGALSTGVSGSAASLDLPFAGAATLDPLVTFTRASTATFTGSNGLIQSATTNTPRFDYDPVTLAAKGLLIEEQRTNLLTYSEDFSNAVWVKNFCTITANSTTAPDGTTNADTFVESVDSVAQGHYVYQGPTLAAGQSYTLTCYAKAISSTRLFQLYVRDSASTVFASSSFNLATGAIPFVTAGTSSITNVGNGRYLLTVTGTAGAAGVGLLLLSSKNLSGLDYIGDGSSVAFIWGVQLEAGAFATSYIPTTTPALTRAADVASVNTLAPWYNNTEYTLYYEGMVQANNDGVVYAGIGDTFDNTAYLSRTAPNQLWAVRSGGVNQTAPLSSTFTPTADVPFKMAGTVKANAFALCVNGGSVATDTSGVVPLSAVRLGIGNSPWAASGGNQRQQWVRRVTFYPRALSSAEMQAITA